MPAPIGNRNASKGFSFREALRQALLKFTTDEVARGSALYHVAYALVRKGISGEDFAIREIADRLDGRPVQAISGPQGEPISLIERVIVVHGTAGNVLEGELVRESLAQPAPASISVDSD